MAFEPALPVEQLGLGFDAPCGVIGHCHVALRHHELRRLLSSYVVEKCDRAFVAAVKKEMQKVGVVLLLAPPSLGADAMHQRQPENIAVEMHGIPQLPGRACSVIDAMEFRVNFERLDHESLHVGSPKRMDCGHKCQYIDTYDE